MTNPDAILERRRRRITTCAAIAFLALGVTACTWLMVHRPVPKARRSLARVLEVEAQPAGIGSVAAPVVGHGTVRAKHQVNIVPQVSGELVHVHESLVTGKIIPEGELLFEIDPTVYESRRTQANSEVLQLEAALERADQEMKNLDLRIANVERMLAIDEADYETTRELFEKENVGTRRDIDLIYQKYLRQKDALIELTSRRSILPHTRLETQARLEAARARLAQREHDVENTKIRCPFTARVETVSAYKSQVVTAHFSIATLIDMTAFELAVGIDPNELKWLVDEIRPESLTDRGDGDLGPPVSVRWSLSNEMFSWQGFVTRFERVDEDTRMARLVVEIRDLDMKAHVELGSRENLPELAIGMHCRAEFPTRQLEEAITVPRHAIYDNRFVYVAQRDGEDGPWRLSRRRVPMLRSIGDTVLVDYAGRQGTEPCELAMGEAVVVSPLIKPVDGMEVRVRNEGIASVALDRMPALVLSRVDVDTGGG